LIVDDLLFLLILLYLLFLLLLLLLLLLLWPFGLRFRENRVLTRLGGCQSHDIAPNMDSQVTFVWHLDQNLSSTFGPSFRVHWYTQSTYLSKCVFIKMDGSSRKSVLVISTKFHLNPWHNFKTDTNEWTRHYLLFRFFTHFLQTAHTSQWQQADMVTLSLPSIVKRYTDHFWTKYKQEYLVISGFRREVDKICGRQGYYAVVIPCRRFRSPWPLKKVLIGCPETSVTNYHHMLLISQKSADPKSKDSRQHEVGKSFSQILLCYKTSQRTMQIIENELF